MVLDDVSSNNVFNVINLLWYILSPWWVDPLNEIEGLLEMAWESSLQTDLIFQRKLWPWLWFLLLWVSLCQVALVFSTLALKPCWELCRAWINSNSLLDNYLWAYLFYLCLLFLAYYIFHQVNYQNTRHKFRLFQLGPKPLPLGEENP